MTERTYTTHEEARRIVGVISDVIFLHRQQFCNITTQEYTSLRNSLAEDVPEIEFTPGRPPGVVAVAFGGEVRVP